VFKRCSGLLLLLQINVAAQEIQSSKFVFLFFVFLSAIPPPVWFASSERRIDSDDDDDDDDMASAKEQSRDTSNDAPERRGSLAAVEKGKWERLWPVIACGAGLFSDGYLNNVRATLHVLIPYATCPYATAWISPKAT
jgi:hypothetical protein